MTCTCPYPIIRCDERGCRCETCGELSAVPDFDTAGPREIFPPLPPTATPLEPPTSHEPAHEKPAKMPPPLSELVRSAIQALGTLQRLSHAIQIPEHRLYNDSLTTVARALYDGRIGETPATPDVDASLHRAALQACEAVQAARRGEAGWSDAYDMVGVLELVARSKKIRETVPPFPPVQEPFEFHLPSHDTLVSAIFDPGRYAGMRGDRTQAQWAADAVLAVLAEAERGARPAPTSPPTLSQEPPSKTRRLRHIRRNTAYVAEPASFQVSVPQEGLFGIEKGRIVEDGDAVTVYRSEGDGAVYVRFPDEFAGRFVDLPSGSESPVGESTNPFASQAADQDAVEAYAQESYELGKRDGRDEAIQEVAGRLGLDDEYRSSSDPVRHQPDPEALLANIAEHVEQLEFRASPSHPARGPAPHLVPVAEPAYVTEAVDTMLRSMERQLGVRGTASVFRAALALAREAAAQARAEDPTTELERD